ncbi:MAG: penicillin-binding protein [Candidatus Pacebacteria bacterium]|nr:penicillin-binding protein [Candidatus Paceibacterota bacterium]
MKLAHKFLLILCLILVLGGIYLWYLSRDLPDPQSFPKRVIPQSTKIYDRTGKVLLYEVYQGEKRTVISWDQISPYVVYTTLAAEDHTFYTHHGIVLKSVARATLHNLLHPGSLQGGSTITQQLARNAFLTADKTINRKLKELLLTFSIEKNYSKQEILTMYLNQIHFGHNVYGIESASQFYFNKPAKNLSLSESAYLTALIQAPNYYSPYGNHREDLEVRKNWVLSRVDLLNYFPKDVVEKAKQEKVAFAPPSFGIKAPHFVMYVKDILAQQYSDEDLETNGYSIITTLDMRLQTIAEEVVKKYGDLNEKKGAHNLALVALDPKTGQILAMVGSKDYWNIEAEGNVNVTTRIRQPGSALKPIIYATALEKGYSAETILFDTALNGRAANFSLNPAQPYYVSNYDGRTRGPVTLRQALAQSLNIPSVKLLYLVGIQNVLDNAKKLGITTFTQPAQHYGLSLVLGGGGVTLLELTNAYSTFNQEGLFHPYASILEIKDSQSHTLSKLNPSHPQRVFSQQTSRLISDILSDNESRAPIFGYQSALYFPNMQVAVKTGTADEFRDFWAIGYTTSLTAGVWVGNNDRSPATTANALSSELAAPCWHEFIEKASRYYPSSTFTPPTPTTPPNPLKPMLNGKYINDRLYKNKVTGELKTVKEVHTILYFINKNDPVHGCPAQPTDDAQFYNWEIPVLLWAKTNIPNFDQEYNLNPGPDYEALDCEISQPLELPEIIEFPDIPQITLLNPQDGQGVTNDLTIEVQIIGQLGGNRPKVYLNNNLIGEMVVNPNGSYSLILPYSQLLLESNQIKIEVQDQYNQVNSKVITILKK